MLPCAYILLVSLNSLHCVLEHKQCKWARNKNLSEPLSRCIDSPDLNLFNTLLTTKAEFNLLTIKEATEAP